MVGTSTNDPDVDAISLIPPCKAIHHIDAVTCVQVVDSTFSINFPDLRRETEVRKAKEARDKGSMRAWRRLAAEAHVLIAYRRTTITSFMAPKT